MNVYSTYIYTNIKNISGIPLCILIILIYNMYYIII